MRLWRLQLSVEVLCSSDSLGQYVHATALDDPQFVFHGQKWCCHTCQMSSDGAHQPPHACLACKAPRSSLPCPPWSGRLCFGKLGELRHGVCARGPPVKTIHMLSSKTHRRTPGEVIKLQSCPPGFKVQTSLSDMGQGYQKSTVSLCQILTRTCLSPGQLW